MLKNDVLQVQDETVTKEHFTQVRGNSQDKNAFWKVVSAIAVEKFNMKEVFNMNSTVRLTAIEKLGMFAILDCMTSHSQNNELKAGACHKVNK